MGKNEPVGTFADSEDCQYFELTCDLFFKDKDGKWHIFLHWGNRCDIRFKYRRYRIIHYRSDSHIVEKLTLHVADHNPADTESYNALVKCALENMHSIGYVPGKWWENQALQNKGKTPLS